jgi:serine phosphatase RsbU (regulator of sigma subunit)
MVADAMGHGLISALYTVHLRSAWDDCEAELSAPARFLGQLNQRLHRLAGPEGYFITAVYMVLDVASGRLRYARAGHPAPLLFRRTGAIEVLSERSPAIGMLETATYGEAELNLESGDRLLLFTDGAIDLANPQGEVLAEAGFRQLLQTMVEPTVDLGQIERKLLEFVHPAGLPDDLTMLSVHFLHPGQSSSQPANSGTGNN